MTIFGWDASNFDWSRGPMDLAAARRDGIDFFTHKATEGSNVVHTRYGEALRRARDAGIPVLGAYGIPRTPGGSHGTISQQVDYFLAYVTAQTPWWRDWPDWMWQCDLEHWQYDAVAPQHGVHWCELVEQRTGRAVILYAPKWAYGDSIGGAHPLWQSAYGGNPAAHYREAYALAGGDRSKNWAAYSGRTPVILQYGSRTRIGSQSTCDANAFRGDLAALRALIGGRGTTGGSDDMTPEEHNWLNGCYFEGRPWAGAALTVAQRAEAAVGVLAKTVAAIAEKVDVDPGELAAITQAAQLGAAAALSTTAADITAALKDALAEAGHEVDAAVVERATEKAIRRVLGDAATPDQPPT